MAHHRTFSQPPTPEAWKSYLEHHFPRTKAICAYEACRFGYWIHRQLTSFGYQCLVVNPSDIHTSNKESSNKTDSIDSRKIGKSLQPGLLASIHVPDQHTEGNRRLLRYHKRHVATFDLTETKAIIKEKSDKFHVSHITRDTAFLNNIFTQDAKAYPPHSDVVTGPAAIAAVNSEWVNYGIKEFTEETTSFYGNEEYLIDEGRYSLRYGKQDTMDKRNYINIWKKENGEWKICSNIWNTSLPLASAE